MSFTKRFTLTESWQALTSAGAKGIVQCSQNGFARFHLGASAPADDTGDFIVAENGPSSLQELPFYYAEATDILYGRTSLGDSSQEVVVMATGSAP